MANTTTNLPAAKDAYNASLAALDAAHNQQVNILGIQPVDWGAYDAASTTTTEARATANAAETVYQSAILNNPTVTALITKLTADTAAMKAKTQALRATAATLSALAQAADDVTSVLKVIAKFV